MDATLEPNNVTSSVTNPQNNTAKKISLSKIRNVASKTSLQSEKAEVNESIMRKSSISFKEKLGT
jgi:hypothetical protein